VSSILKALKKLETETQEQQDEPKPSMGLNIRSEKTRRQEKSSGQKKWPTPSPSPSPSPSQWVWMISVLLIFLGAGALITLFSHDRQSPTEVSNYASTNLKTSSTASPQIAVKDSPQFIDSKTPVQPQQAGKTTYGEPPPLPPKMSSPRKEQPQANTPNTPAPAETQQSNIPIDHAAPPEPPGSTPHDMAKDSPPLIDKEPPEPTLTAATHENRSNATDDIDNINGIDTINDIDDINDIPSLNKIPILSDNSLTINAIAWSNDPAKRLAVINSQIVRQGQNVGEFLLVKIEEDQVIIQQSNKRWRVMFRLR
jgi:hypothetical protein